MENEEKQTNVPSEESTDNAMDYIDALNQLKQNSVEREKYEALRAENKKLLDSIVNGQTIEQTVVESPKNIQEMRNSLFNEENSNLDYITKALDLRDALIERGEPDPFLPYGKQIVPTEEDINAANRVAAVLKECVDYAEGDSAVFTNELQRRTLDVKVR